MRNPSSKRLGLTLLEVMIAAGVLALAMVMAMASIVSISATTAQADDQAAAAAAVSSLIEQLRATPPANIRDFNPPVPNARMQASVAVVTQNGDLALPAAVDVAPGVFQLPIQLRVRVDWVDNAGRAHNLDTITTVGE